MLLGVPRMRQIRIKNNSCKVHKDFQDEIMGCFDVYNEKKEDDLSFGLINGTAWAAHCFHCRVTLGVLFDTRIAARLSIRAFSWAMFVLSCSSAAGPTTQRKTSRVPLTGACWPPTVEQDTIRTWVKPRRRAPSYWQNWWTTFGLTEEPEQSSSTSPLITQTSTCSVSSGKEQLTIATSAVKTHWLVGNHLCGWPKFYPLLAGWWLNSQQLVEQSLPTRYEQSDWFATSLTGITSSSAVRLSSVYSSSIMLWRRFLSCEYTSLPTLKVSGTYWILWS